MLRDPNKKENNYFYHVKASVSSCEEIALSSGSYRFVNVSDFFTASCCPEASLLIASATYVGKEHYASHPHLAIENKNSAYTFRMT